MRTVVFGATGGTGRQLVEQACRSGHEVRAVVRDRSKLDERRPAPADNTGRTAEQVRGFPASNPGLTVLEADVMDPVAIAPIIADCAAVVSTLGPAGARAPTSVCTDGATSIVKGMREADVQRLVVVSAAGISTDGDGPFTKYVVKPILQRALRHPFDDARRMEAVVRESGLDWTIVRPPRLTNGPHTGRYRSAVDVNVRRGFRISRADLADAILRCITEPGPVGAVLSVAR